MYEYRSTPNEADWAKLQGGKPKVEQVNPKVVNVIHDYPGGEGMIVPTSLPISKMGTVNYSIDTDIVRFPVALVRALHGIPCEQASHAIGGRGYDRIKQEP